jgi:hypothetical protein
MVGNADNDNNKNKMMMIELIIILIVPKILSSNIHRVYYFFLYSKRKIPCTCCLVACLNYDKCNLYRKENVKKNTTEI